MCVEIGEDPLTSLSLWSKELNVTEFNNNFNDKRTFNWNKSIKQYVKIKYERRIK